MEAGALRRLWPELRPFRGLMALAVVLVVSQSLLVFVPPQILGDIVNRLQRGESIDTVRYLLLIVGFTSLQGLLGYGLAVTVSTLGQSFLLGVRDKMFGHLASLPLAYFEKNQPGKIVSNVINDAATVNQLITGSLPTMMGDAVQLVLVIVLLVRMDPALAALSLCVAPVYVLNFRRVYPKLTDASDAMRSRRDAMYGQMQEKLAGIATVKGYGQERFEARTFMSTTREIMGLNVRQGVLGSALWTVADALCGVATGLVLWFGGLKCLRGEMEPGTLVVFLLYAVGYVYGPVVRFLVALDPVSRAQAALARIFRTLDEPNAVGDAPDAVEMPPVEGRVRFEDVWFEYVPGQPVLKGIALDVAPGQTVALVGFSGSGKTTMASLLLRHYDPTSGRITVDGRDLRSVRLRSYRSQIGVVAQESVLFNGTIRDNVRYGRPDATDEEVEEACRAANIHAAIEALPDGYESRFGEDGAQLSVGEKQRVAIARALLADPRILLLDEATSSLDSQTEALLQQALDRLMRGRTSFVIAHRLSTIVDADQIVVLEGGVVTQRGTHAELLAQEGLYARLYREQFRVALGR